MSHPSLYEGASDTVDRQRGEACREVDGSLHEPWLETEAPPPARDLGVEPRYLRVRGFDRGTQRCRRSDVGVPSETQVSSAEIVNG